MLVSGRSATAGDVECVTPSRGILSGRVDAALLPDWRTNSFVLPPVSKPAYFRYVRF